LILTSNVPVLLGVLLYHNAHALQVLFAKF